MNYVEHSPLFISVLFLLVSAFAPLLWENHRRRAKAKAKLLTALFDTKTLAGHAFGEGYGRAFASLISHEVPYSASWESTYRKLHQYGYAINADEFKQIEAFLVKLNKVFYARTRGHDMSQTAWNSVTREFEQLRVIFCATFPWSTPETASCPS